MHYVVVDLEWNQPLSHLSSAFRKVGDRLMFEVIQIGAVKLDEGLRMTGSFNRLITPEHYLKLHPRIRRITGITQDDLRDAPPFADAYGQFLNWCGKDAALLTWGGDDISVLKERGLLRHQGRDAAFYDLQKLYCILEERNKEHRGLQAAMAAYQVPQSEEHPFHSAVDDAYYTARVFQRFPDSRAVLEYPQQPRPIGRQKPGRQESRQDLAVRSEHGYLMSAAAKLVPCPVCSRKGKVTEGYVPQRSGMMALADCPDHGLMFVEVQFVRDEENRLVARRSVSLSDEQSPAYVATKHLQWANKVAQLQESEAAG